MYSELIDDKAFEKIKNYLKVDEDYEDDLIKDFLDAVALELVVAVDTSKETKDFLMDPRFHLAVKKQAKEEYEQRGLSADTMRYQLSNGVENIIHQLRHAPFGGDTLDDPKDESTDQLSIK